MAPLTINSTVKLASGHEMPRLGFGVSRGKGSMKEDKKLR